MVSKLNEDLVESMNQAIRNNEFKKITSIAIYQDSNPLFIKFYNKTKPNYKHDTRSVGKSFTSTMIGIAIRDGHIKSTSQTLGDFYDLSKFDNYSKKKEQVTLHSLMTMSSAFNGSDNSMDSPGNEEYMYPTDDWVKFALDLPMRDDREIGETWDYFTAGVVVLGDILNKLLPGGLAKYAKSHLFDPLEIKDYDWPTTPTNVPITAGGIRLTTKDLAKFGLLYLNNGKHNGIEILPEDWVKLTFKSHIPLEGGYGHYGYLFWNKTYTVNENTYETWFATGNGGNKIMCFKELNLVIVITATAYGQKYMHRQIDELLEKYLLKMVELN